PPVPCVRLCPWPQGRPTEPSIHTWARCPSASSEEKRSICMPTPVKMPRLGESVAEGTIGSWLKQEGETVEKDEALAEVITDKINAELPSPVAGRLTKILVKADETVAVGADIAFIEENADVSVTPTQEPEPAPGPDAAPVDNTRQAATSVIEDKVARGEDGARTAAPGRSTGGTSQTQTQTIQRTEEERQRISPLARRLAREHDIDLNQIAGTGTGGRVRKGDILAYVEQRQAAPAAVSAASSYTAPPATQQAVPQPAAAATEQSIST